MFPYLLPQALARAAALADHHGVTPETPDTDLLTLGPDGHVMLVARHAERLGADITRAARAGAAPREDLESAAVLAFLSRLSTYDPQRGAGVYTYAHPAIREELQNTNNAYSARPGTNSDYQRFWKAMAVCDNDAVRAREWSDLQRRTGHELQDLADAGNTLADEILHLRISQWERKGMPVAAMMGERGRGLPGHVFDALHESLNYTSVDAPAGESGEVTYGDIAQDPNAERPFTDADDRVSVRQMLASLPDRDADVLAGLFGIDTPTLTPQEVADKHGLAPSRVRAIKADACKRLREALP
ncbi:sigma-70 family RNA polymerase sigma factor [Nocardiopsis alba]|uniref:sigma-70 family RNA polymerase sigma factor n=1 Tax=Nocardiopsis alba TaxID=53437 RepID=UPI00380B9D58